MYVTYTSHIETMIPGVLPKQWQLIPGLLQEGHIFLTNTSTCFKLVSDILTHHIVQHNQFYIYLDRLYAEYIFDHFGN